MSFDIVQVTLSTEGKPEKVQQSSILRNCYQFQHNMASENIDNRATTKCGYLFSACGSCIMGHRE